VYKQEAVERSLQFSVRHADRTAPQYCLCCICDNSKNHQEAEQRNEGSLLHIPVKKRT
jgi:hypothetical protein